MTSYKSYTLNNFKKIPQIEKLSKEQQFDIEVVGNVLPFKTNNYVIEELINWDNIPNVVRPYFVKKVVVVGTESSGKSTLTKHLAKLYNTNYVEEYGRALCEKMGGYDGIFTPDLFRIIAYGHKMSEFKEINYSNKILFIDTEIIVTQYFSELLVGRDPLLDIIAEKDHYDLWIYLEPDIEWISDGYRTYGEGDDRRQNNIKLKKMLDERNIKYHIIGGSYIERITGAIKLVDEIIQK